MGTIKLQSLEGALVTGKDKGRTMKTGIMIRGCQIRDAVSLGGNENVLQLIVVMDAQLL